MPLYSEHISNMYYGGTPSYSSPYSSYGSSLYPLGSSYSASYLNPGGNYSNHSSIGSYSRAPLTSRWIPGLSRNYSPMLTPISERGTSSPVRINSPRRIPITKRRSYGTSGYTQRPININTADIDVSRDRYRHKSIETTASAPSPALKPPMHIVPSSDEKDKSPFMPRVDGKPETGIDSSPGLQRNTIKRGRTVVRLHTVKRKERDSPRKPIETVVPQEEMQKASMEDAVEIPDDNVEKETNESKSWREKLSEDLIYTDKKEKKSLGTKFVETFIVKDFNDQENKPQNNVRTEKSTVESLPLDIQQDSELPKSYYKSPDRRCSMELLAEQASLLDSLIRRENLSTATLDLSKVGVLEDSKTNIDPKKRKKTGIKENPLKTTKSDQSLHENLKSLRNSKDSKPISKRRSLKKSSSGGSIFRLDSITEFPKDPVDSDLPVIEENRPSLKIDITDQKPKPKLKARITTSVEISPPATPLKFRIENVIVEEKVNLPKKEIIFSSVVENIPTQDITLQSPLRRTKERHSIKKKVKITNNALSPEPEDGNFWDKIGKRETVYLMKRKQNIEEVKEKHKRSLFWFPEDDVELTGGENNKDAEKIDLSSEIHESLAVPDFQDRQGTELEHKEIVKEIDIQLGGISKTEKNNYSNIINSEMPPSTDDDHETKPKTERKLNVSQKEHHDLLEDGSSTKSVFNEALAVTFTKNNLEKTYSETIKESINEEAPSNSSNVYVMKDKNDTTLKSNNSYSKTKIANDIKEIINNDVIESNLTSSINIKAPVCSDFMDIKDNKTQMEKLHIIATQALLNAEPKIGNRAEESINVGVENNIEKKLKYTPHLKDINTQDNINSEENFTLEIKDEALNYQNNVIETSQISDTARSDIIKNPQESSIEPISFQDTSVSEVMKEITSQTREELMKTKQNEISSTKSTEKEVKQLQSETTTSTDEGRPEHNSKTEKTMTDSLSKNKQIASLPNIKLLDNKNTLVDQKCNIAKEKAAANDSKKGKSAFKVEPKMLNKSAKIKTEAGNMALKLKDTNATQKCPIHSAENKTDKISPKNGAKISDQPITAIVQSNKNAEETNKGLQNAVVSMIKTEPTSSAAISKDSLLPNDTSSTTIPQLPIVIESENIPKSIIPVSLGQENIEKDEKTSDAKPETKIEVQTNHIKELSVKAAKPRKPIKEEKAHKPLIATPRPLQKRVAQIIHSSESSDSSSDDESSDEEEESDTSEGSTEFFECENNTDGRTSTGSNDSGFDSSAPTSPATFMQIKKDCDVNCHRKCEKLTANLCGVNQRLLVEALATRTASKKGADSPGASSSNATSQLPASDILEQELEQSTAYGLFRKTGRFTPPARSIPRFRKYTIEDFQFIKVLGKGSFGKVLLAELRDTEYYYAVKCLKKDVVLEDDDVECTLIERKVLALGTNHPYLCHLFATFQTDSHLFFVMEYLNGGDLMFHIQQSGRFPEARARFYAAEIVSGLKFLHKRGIVYRDLKLDNILLDFDGHVRIADFGMCKLQIYLEKTADTFCGTPDYMAPEIIKGLKYNQTVDWWSFGVLLYEMLIGQSPFSGCDEDELFWSICNEMPSYPRFLSQEALTILTRLLDKDARTRLGGVECMHGDIREQDFFHHVHWDRLERRELEAPFRPRVRHPLDTQYFDRAFTGERPRLTAVEPQVLRSMDQEPFRGFSYTNPNATDR